MARFIEELTLKVKAHYIAKDIKMGLAEQGIEVGKGKDHAEARAWIRRKSEAMARCKSLDEPFPWGKAKGTNIRRPPEVRAWLARMNEAKAQGKPFTKPFPFPFPDVESEN